MTTSAVPRPVMRYHGGKWRIAPWIIAHMPAHRVYVEPFGGAASVLMLKPRCYAEVYNDLSDDVVNVFRVLRDPESARELERLIRLTPFARAEFELSYEPAEDSVERARRMIAQSFMGYGSTGGSRNRRTGYRGRGFEQRIPTAAEWAQYPDAIGAFTARLQGVTIERRPALELIRGLDKPDVLIYADPPYVMSTRTSMADGRKHFAHELTDQDHAELAEALHASKGMVIISGYRCELYDRLYAGWRRVERSSRSMLNKPRMECLWLSPAVRHVQLAVGEQEYEEPS